MQVSVEKTSELSRKMTVTIAEDVIQEKVNERLKTIARDVRIDGFRPGKVPQKVIENRYGARTRDEVIGALVQENYASALQESNLSPVGMPKIEPAVSDAGFAFTAIFEVSPEFSLAGIADITVDKPITRIESQDVDVLIEKLRTQEKTWQPSEQDAQEGSRMSLKLSGICEGENFTEGTVDDHKVVLGTKSMIPGFEDRLIGLAVGDTKKFAVNFPGDYINNKLAGKFAEFDVEVLKIEELVLPELDAQFIKTYGVESGDLNEFRADVEKNMQRELEQALKTLIKNTVMDALIENVPMALPETMIDKESESLLQLHNENQKKQSKEVKKIQLTKANFEDLAKRRVALGLILGEIVQQNEIKAEPDKMRAIIDNIAQGYEQPEELVSYYYDDESHLAEVQQMVLENAVVDWVLSQVKVIDKVTSFGDIMDAVRQQ